MLGVFLGAGFSRWAADLPLTPKLFDFNITPRHCREARRVEFVKNDYTCWLHSNPAGTAEQFIEWALDEGGKRSSKRVIWYVTRRLSDPFVARIAGGTQTLMIDDRRAREHPGVVRARDFFMRFIRIGASGILTSNYDMLVEYAYGTSNFHYGLPGERLHGRGKNPWFPWQGQPVHLGGNVGFAKLHGSLSWDSERRYTDARCGLTGKALIVPPRPGKPPAQTLLNTWRYGETILSATTKLVVFGFAFNAYDTNLLKLLAAAGKGIQQVLLIDPEPKLAEAKAVWPHAQIVSMKPEFDYTENADQIFSRAARS